MREEKEMAIINCPECGKEISDQSDRCLHCGCPIKKGAKVKQAKNTIKEKKRIIIAVAAVLLVAIAGFVIFKVMSNDVFTPYLKYIGKSYKDLPYDYEIEGDEVKLVSVATEDIANVPGNMVYDLKDNEKINEAFWTSTNTRELSESDIKDFENEIVKIYGKWDKKEEETTYSSIETNYTWENSKGFHIMMNIDTANSHIRIAWFEPTEY